MTIGNDSGYPQKKSKALGNSSNWTWEAYREEVKASGYSKQKEKIIPEDCTACTWQEYLQRLEYIDKIIDQIVHSAILLNINFFTAFGFLQVKGTEFENEFPIHSVSFLIAFFGMLINIFLAKSLMRQEHFRLFYKSQIKAKKPLIFPTEDANTENVLHKIGKMRPGYCESWICILLSIGIIFFYLTCSSY